MATVINSRKWLHFSGESEDFPTCSTRFIASMETKVFYKKLFGNEDIIRQPGNLPENPSNEQRAARDAQQRV